MEDVCCVSELDGHFVAVSALLAAGDASHRVDLSRNGYVSKSRFGRRQGHRNPGKTYLLYRHDGLFVFAVSDPVVGIASAETDYRRHAGKCCLISPLTKLKKITRRTLCTWFPSEVEIELGTYFCILPSLMKSDEPECERGLEEMFKATCVSKSVRRNSLQDIELAM